MSFVQVLTPNPAVGCQPGWCLKYVSDAFGVSNIPHTNYSSATAAWNASIQHQDQSFPDGLWVPVWFSLRDEPAGHVALRAPDGSIYSSSSPTSTTAVHHTSLAALIAYYARANPLTYLGWSEDMGGTKVIQAGEVMSVASLEDVKYLYESLRGEALNDADLQATGYVGKSYEWVVKDISKYTFDHGQDYYAYRQFVTKGMAELSAQLTAAKASDGIHAQQLSQATVDLSTAQAALKSEQDKGAGLAKNLDDSQLALDDANKQLAQAESIASDDDAKIKDLTAKLSEAQATIDQLKAQADKPPAATTPQTPQSTATTSSAQPTQTSALGRWVQALVSFLGGGK